MKARHSLKDWCCSLQDVVKFCGKHTEGTALSYGLSISLFFFFFFAIFDLADNICCARAEDLIG